MSEYIMRYENDVLQLLPDKIQPLVRCKDCQCRDDPHAIISEWLPCQIGKTPDEWFCASGRKKVDR